MAKKKLVEVITLVMIAILTIVFCISLVFNIISCIQNCNNFNTLNTTKAIVINFDIYLFKRSSGKILNKCYLTINYYDNKNTSYTSTLTVKAFYLYQGQKIKIKYNPNNPSQCIYIIQEKMNICKNIFFL